jgi:hypothetical protein
MAENTQNYNGRVFSSNLTTPGVSFAATFRGSTAQQQKQQQQQQQQPQVRQFPVADPPAEVKFRTPASGKKQKAGQSVRARTVNS